MADLPEFTLTIDDIGATVAGATGLEAVAFTDARVKFIPNIYKGDLLSYGGTLRTPRAVYGTINSSGVLISDETGTPGVSLVADADYGLEETLSHKVVISGAKVDGFDQPITAWSFPAQEPASTFDLSELAPVPGLSAKGVTRGPQGIEGPPGDMTTEELNAAIAAAVNAVINGAPGALDTLLELAAALDNDADFAATMTTALAAKLPGTLYATVAALKAATTASTGYVFVSGYYAAGDGGGGVFRWDSTDTTSADNGGTIITPSGGLSSSGRWKRVYEGEVNARWFGAHPGQSATVNTAAFQAAIDWIQSDETRNPSGGYGSGTLFIPMGYYRVNGPITVSENYVQIRGEGPGTMLTVRDNAYPSTLDYLFIFAASYKAIGWGVSDLTIAGNSMLKWAIKLDTCHASAFENILVNDVHGGSLYAESTLSPNCGENVLVRHVDYNSTSSNPTTGCLTQNNIVFKSTSGASWSDCEIEDCMAVGIWDYGVVLDGVIRFKVNKCDVSLNYSSPNTIDGASHAGVHGIVKVTHTVNGTWSSANGQHVIDGSYHESHEGSEDVVNYAAIAIESPVGGGGYNRGNRIYNINTSWNVPLAPALLRITNANGVDGQVADNHFTANRRPVSHNQIQIGANVRDTHLHLAPNLGLLRTIKVYDSGTRTRINGVINAAYRNAATYPDNTVTSGEVDIGEVYRDTVTGRTVLQDQYNDSVLIGPRPGVDVVSPYGAQRIQSLPTPAAPRVTPVGSGSTTWTYYVVAIDKDGNKTPPSPAGSTTAGPASLSSSTYNAVQWFPVDGAVKYDLLRGATNTSIATNLVNTHYDDPGTSTSAYTPSAVSPPGNLTVDGALALAGVNTLANGSTLAFHNQTDQTTNYERVRHFWSTNRYFIYAENGGSGTLRPIEIRSRGGVVLWQTPIAPATGTIQVTDSTSSANTAILGVNGTLSASSIGGGPQIALAVWPTINQSSTAAFTALSVNVTETAVGSGAQLLADFAVGGVSKAKIDDDGLVTVSSLDLGSTTDATVTRSAAGRIAVEGVDVAMVTDLSVVTANRQTASYTLVLGDAGKAVEMNVASANDLTVPLNSSVAFPTGTIIEIGQYGAGQTTIVATGGVTIRSAGGKLKLTGQYSGASLRKIGVDEWWLVGDIAA